MLHDEHRLARLDRAERFMRAHGRHMGFRILGTARELLLLHRPEGGARHARALALLIDALAAAHLEGEIEAYINEAVGLGPSAMPAAAWRRVCFARAAALARLGLASAGDELLAEIEAGGGLDEEEAVELLRTRSRDTALRGRWRDAADASLALLHRLAGRTGRWATCARAEIHHTIAFCAAHVGEFGIGSMEQHIHIVIRLGRRAGALPMVIRSLGNLMFGLTLRDRPLAEGEALWAEAERLLRAYRLAPATGSATLLVNYSRLLNQHGRDADAAVHARAAWRLFEAMHFPRAMADFFPQIETALQRAGDDAMVRTVRAVWRAHEARERGRVEVARADDEFAERLTGFYRRLQAERAPVQREAGEQVQFDALTGRPTRILLRERLRDWHERRVWAAPDGRRFVAMQVDIDGFGEINRSMGYGVGDHLLTIVAERLAALPVDLCARVQSDAFVIVAQGDTGIDTVPALVAAVQSAISQPIDVIAPRLQLTACIGHYSGPDPWPEPDSVLIWLEMALARAKSLGPGSVAEATPELRRSLSQRAVLDVELRRALRNREFMLLYQPKVEVGSGRIVGFEALMRWVHPQRGTVSPGEFIPVLESTGLIQAAGLWVLDAALQQLARWLQDGVPMAPIAINVSMVQARRAGFASEVIERLAYFRVPPQWLQIELTESSIFGDDAGIEVVLRQLADAGITICLDDFGTGYSNVAQLMRLPISSVKLDQTFVARVTDGPRQHALVRLVIEMAHAMDCDTVAEGVEREAQRAALEALGCDSIQGYLYARPLAPDVATRLLARGEPLLPGAIASAAPPAAPIATPAPRSAPPDRSGCSTSCR